MGRVAGRGIRHSVRLLHTVGVTSARKDPALTDLVERLRRDLGADYFVLADHWEGDLLATGLGRPDDPTVLVYIAMQLDATDDGPDYRLLGSLFYECELPTADGLYEVPDRGDGVGYPEVLAAVSNHLAPLAS